MYTYTVTRFHILIFLTLVLALGSCKKLVRIDEPNDSLTTQKMFRTGQQAEGALVGIYTSLIHGTKLSGISNPAGAFQNSFAGGLSTFAGGVSSDELASGDQKLATHQLAYATAYWSSAYTGIYLANSVVEGLEATTSPLLRDSVKQQYKAEAKLLRAFTYLYLTQYFGDVPLALTIDFNQTKLIPRTPQLRVYQQILEDLKEAYATLPQDYAAGQGRRVRVNKWTAAALLARTYLYMKDYNQAALYATEVIEQTHLYQLEPLNRTFLTDSREAIFQLMQSDQNSILKNATPEGYYVLPNPLQTGVANVLLTPQLRNAFQENDQRYTQWVDSTEQTETGEPPFQAWYACKYKTGEANSVFGAPSNEYYMVVRLAEMYLIRAEARAYGANGGSALAVEDLNIIRSRAGLSDLPLNLSIEETKSAVWQERQIELFAEWGHRWIDLKRSGKAIEVLSSLPNNKPWEGDWQLLYPIPEAEIRANPNLVQNPGYNQIR